MKQGGGKSRVTHNKKEYTFEIKEEISLPAKTLNVEDYVVKLKEFDSVYHNEELIIHGQLIESVIYQLEGGTKEAKVEKPNFKYFLPLSEQSSQLEYKLNLDIEQIQYKFKSTAYQKQTLVSNIKLKLIITVFPPLNSLDSLASNIYKNLETKKLILNKFLAEKETNLLIKQKLKLAANIERIFECKANLKKVKVEKIEEEVMITGQIIYQVLALNNQGQVKHYEIIEPFRETTYFKKTNPGAQLLAQNQISDLEFVKLEDTLEVMLVVNAVLTAYQEVEMSIYTNSTGQRGEQIKVKQEINNLHEEWMLTDELILDISYKELIEMKGQVVNVEVELISNKIIVSGELSYELYYIDLHGQEKNKNFNLNFNKLLKCQGTREGLEFKYQLKVKELQPELKQGRLILKTFLKLVGNLREEVLTKVVTEQNGIISQSVLDSFLVERVLKVDKLELLLPYELYLGRYAKQVQDIDIKIINPEGKLLTGSLLYSCQLKSIINFIDYNDIEQEITKIENINELLPTEINIKEANLDISPQIKYIDYELSNAGEKLLLKVVLKCPYKILERVRLPILTKKVSVAD
ncbi:MULTISPECIES: SPOCS domain-containing protein [unclassified Candidatus Frackibacter]|uniref:SPOCS domain-containing protein n=1 Tax=unclassified Candidatus Frackibacter TaxID=2648818 RepID=UPI00088D3460|nr:MULTISPECIES: SPOCS domain-containing protein [unclassified Candidatus Frackibacter]SDC65923.1 protein of unknown function [Candidatus Frackibacter sp. WG11]SEM79058.1 protein of unknown function [Candidatus Frackibacter sp. WG12]SFL89845.1 protein of unknown function [Candidatus Frackibacter sp. WG13]